MAVTWETAFVCQRCFPPKRNYCKGQEWGQDNKGRPEFRMSCFMCGWSDVTNEDWRNGK